MGKHIVSKQVATVLTVAGLAGWLGELQHGEAGSVVATAVSGEARAVVLGAMAGLSVAGGRTAPATLADEPTPSVRFTFTPWV